MPDREESTIPSKPTRSILAFRQDASAGWLFPRPSIANSCPAITSPAPTGIVPEYNRQPVRYGLAAVNRFLFRVHVQLSAGELCEEHQPRACRLRFHLPGRSPLTTRRAASRETTIRPTQPPPPLGGTGAITRGLSDFNVTRNLSINWLYQIPTPKAFRWAGRDS